MNHCEKWAKSNNCDNISNWYSFFVSQYWSLKYIACIWLCLSISLCLQWEQKHHSLNDWQKMNTNSKYYHNYYFFLIFHGSWFLVYFLIWLMKHIIIITFVFIVHGFSVFLFFNEAYHNYHFCLLNVSILSTKQGLD